MLSFFLLGGVFFFYNSVFFKKIEVWSSFGDTYSNCGIEVLVLGKIRLINYINT